MKNNFTDSDIRDALNRFSAKAEAFLNDRGKLRSLLHKAQDFLRRAADLPVLGPVIENVVDMTCLLEDYADGRYREVPTSALISMVAAILYLLTPVDLVPDWIPILGWLDDLAVVSLALSLGADRELKRWREWKKQHMSDDVVEADPFEDFSDPEDFEGFDL